MGKREKDIVSPGDGAPDGALEAFVDRAAAAIEDDEGAADVLKPPGEPAHRRLRVVVSEDRLEARIEAVFPGTTPAEAAGALKQAGVVYGIRAGGVKEALAQAGRSGHLQRDVLAAKGRPALYLKRKEVVYPFLKGHRMPDTGEPVHLASSVFREIAGVMGGDDIEKIRGHGRPVLAASPGEVLMVARGEDEVQPGRDVFGNEVRRTEEEEGPGALRAGNGVDLHPDGSITALIFGYISVSGGFLSVVSPIWISPDRMAAYYVNPPQLGERKVPDPDTILLEMADLKIRFGIDRQAIAEMCGDLRAGALRESCVRIARGRAPNLPKGGTRFDFELSPPGRFEAVQNAFQMLSLEDVTANPMRVSAVHAGAVIAERSETGEASGPGKDLFGKPVAPPEEGRERKLYKAGTNVRRVVEGDSVRYISEIYGYAGVLGDRIMVVSPMWVSPDRMAACFVALPQNGQPSAPKIEEVEALLERSGVRNGVDPAAVAGLCLELPPADDPDRWAVRLARGTPPKPGGDGRVKLLFKEMPDPGKLLEGGGMDFRERDAVPQVHVGQLLARRSFPTEGTPGMDVRGRTLKPPRPSRELLYAGPNVTVEEKGGEQLFYAVQPGWARVIKDTLGVMNRFHHRGDVDYGVGNLKMDGDAEIEGTLKSRFKVEATGDVYIAGAVERRAQVIAGGNVVVQRGVIGAKVSAGGSLCARFIQESEVVVGADLLVRNFVRDSTVQVGGKAVVQGNEGGARQLCLLGGVLAAASGVDAASIGSMYGRQTQVVAGIDMGVMKRLERYRKGLAFSDLNSRRAMRALEALVGKTTRGKADMVAAMKRVSPSRREFLLRQVGELETLRKLKVSLEHHIEGLEKERAEIAGRARIRALGTAFAKAIVQVGEMHRVLDADVQSVVFLLNRQRTQIVERFLDRAE